MSLWLYHICLGGLRDRVGQLDIRFKSGNLDHVGCKNANVFHLGILVVEAIHDTPYSS